MSSPSEASSEGALRARARPGLHEAAERELLARAPRGVPVLDLGGGTGAWATRLARHGFAVTVLDLDDAGFGARGIEFHRADLNADFAAALGERRYPVITALEIIEHLENPRRFLRECAQLLEPGGLLLLTTPNVQSVRARLHFLLTGQIAGFGPDPAFSDPTHITPIQTDLFAKMVAASGLRIEAHAFDTQGPGAGRRSTRLVVRALSPLLRGVKGAENHIYLLRKP